jgi:hypothetical protein
VNFLLVNIGGYFKLNYHKILMVINGYQWLFYCRPLMVILLVVIDDYYISGYCIISHYWIFYIILS